MLPARPCRLRTQASSYETPSFAQKYCMLDKPQTSRTSPYGASCPRSRPAALKKPTSPETSTDTVCAPEAIASAASRSNGQTVARSQTAVSRWVANTASDAAIACTASPVRLSGAPMPAPMI